MHKQYNHALNPLTHLDTAGPCSYGPASWDAGTDLCPRRLYRSSSRNTSPSLPSSPRTRGPGGGRRPRRTRSSRTNWKGIIFTSPFLISLRHRIYWVDYDERGKMAIKEDISIYLCMYIQYFAMIYLKRVLFSSIKNIYNSIPALARKISWYSVRI